MRLWHGELPSRRLLLGAGFVSSILIAVSSFAPTSSITSKIPGSWFFGIPGGYGTLYFLSGFWGQVLFYLGFSLGLGAWFELVRSTRAGRYTIRDLVRIGITWFAPLLIAGPLYSRDVYSYAAIGEMVSRHISPYLYGPNILGATPYLNTVDPFWGNAPAPYGPIFLWLSGLMAVITKHDAFVTMIGLRVMAIGATVCVAVLAVKLAKVKGKDPKLALVLVGLNPLLIFSLASSAHNDTYMIVFLLAGLVAFYRRHPLVAVVLISVAAAVKIPAIVGVVFVAWAATPGNQFKTKLKPMMAYGAVSLSTLAAASLATGIGWGWINNLGTPGMARSPAVPTLAAAAWSDRIFSLVGLSLGFGNWLTVYRAAGFLLAGVAALYFLYKSELYGMDKAIGYTLLALVLFGPVIQPWYIAWGLVLVATSPTARTINGVVMVSIFGMLLGIPYGPSIVSWTVYVMLALGMAVYAADRLGWRVASVVRRWAELSASRFSHSA